jgi:hypothetical protein
VVDVNTERKIYEGLKFIILSIYTSMYMAQDVLRKSKTSKIDYSTMVEKTIKKSDIYLSEKQLRTRLPKQITDITFKKILKNLENTNKIMYDKDNTIIWTFADNDEIRRTIKESTILR